MNLLNLYYRFSSIWYKRKIKDLGKHVALRFGAVIYHGEKIHIGNDCQIGKGFVCAIYPEYAGQKTPAGRQGSENGIFIGERVTANRNLTIFCADKVEVGNGTMLGSTILITDNNHGTNAGEMQQNYREQPLTTKAVSIGKDCWIAEQSCILPGAHIGNKCIVAANAVVTSGIYPDKCILAGNPARIIRIWDEEKNEWRKCSGNERKKNES